MGGEQHGKVWGLWGLPWLIVSSTSAIFVCFEKSNPSRNCGPWGHEIGAKEGCGGLGQAGIEQKAGACFWAADQGRESTKRAELQLPEEGQAWGGEG